MASSSSPLTLRCYMIECFSLFPSKVPFLVFVGHLPSVYRVPVGISSRLYKIEWGLNLKPKALEFSLPENTLDYKKKKKKNPFLFSFTTLPHHVQFSALLFLLFLHSPSTLSSFYHSSLIPIKKIYMTIIIHE